MAACRLSCRRSRNATRRAWPRNARAGRCRSQWRDDRGTLWCVFHDRAVPAVVRPTASNYHIVQSRDFIVMTYEWNTERRIIPLDGRPHAPESVRSYAGDSRGRWEGDTLVIETTNFTPKRFFPGLAWHAAGDARVAGAEARRTLHAHGRRHRRPHLYRDRSQHVDEAVDG
jgi:hypothetical protein